MGQKAERLETVSLVAIREIDAVCESAGIDESDREYTVFSVEDLEFDLGLVKQAILKKSLFIENQVILLWSDYNMID